MKQIAQEMLETYVDARRPMIYINHFDAAVVDDMLRCVAHGASVVEYNNAFGLVDFDDKHTVEECDLERFLNLTYEDGFERQTFLLLRDVSGELSDAKISALLKRISELILHNDDYQCTVFIADAAFDSFACGLRLALGLTTELQHYEEERSEEALAVLCATEANEDEN